MSSGFIPSEGAERVFIARLSQHLRDIGHPGIPDLWMHQSNIYLCIHITSAVYLCTSNLPLPFFYNDISYGI